MKGGNKVIISYEDLSNPKVDEIIAHEVSLKTKVEPKPHEKKIKKVDRRWLLFAAVAVIGALIIWGVVGVFNHILSPKDRNIEIGNSQYVLSKEAQKYLKILTTSDYEKLRSVIIIEEPHYSIEGQVSLFKGLEVLFRENPGLVDKTIFLSEGLPSGQHLNIKPLLEVESNPDERLIREVLSSFLIPGYIAYEWKYKKKIPIIGIENRKLYKLCAKLWVEAQKRQEFLKLWEYTVFCRNENIANLLIELTEFYENPILFVGGLHLKHDESPYQESKYNGFGNIMTSEDSVYLCDFKNLGIYNYLKKEKIGYTFLVATSNNQESSRDQERNIKRYIELFKAQQNEDYNRYIEYLISEKTNAVTVIPSTEAAARFVEASANSQDKGKDENEDNDKDKNEDSEKNSDDSNKGKDNNGNHNDPPREATRDGDKIEEGKDLSEKEASEKVGNGQDVIANSKEQAEKIARDASDGKDPIHEEPHKPGFKPHYHNNHHGKGHVFY